MLPTLDIVFRMIVLMVVIREGDMLGFMGLFVVCLDIMLGISVGFV